MGGPGVVIVDALEGLDFKIKAADAFKFSQNNSCVSNYIFYKFWIGGFYTLGYQQLGLKACFLRSRSHWSRRPGPDAGAR